MLRTSLRLLVCTALLSPIAPATAADSCNNTCTDYPAAWGTSCPEGQRCIAFKNSCSFAINLSYQIGCDADGNPGAPQCNCTDGPSIASGGTAYWTITDVDDSSSCVPKNKPACLTSGLAVLVNQAPAQTCTGGTRVEFTAGNHADTYGKLDSYNIDVEKTWYSVPLVFKPDAPCSSTGPLDCRPLWCNSTDCPDAYSAPTTGKCTARSPQAACQNSFGNFGSASGFTVETCPSQCPSTGSTCPSCQDSTACS